MDTQAMAAAVLAEDRIAGNQQRGISWRQDSGIMRATARLDFNLTLPSELLIQQLDALADRLKIIAADGRRLNDEAARLSMIGGALYLERQKLRRK